jgi:hypothetical protein
MENVIRFPPRYLHPEEKRSWSRGLRIINMSLGACNVDDLAMMAQFVIVP